MNYVDAEIIVSTLAERGGKPTPDQLKADLIIVVSCGVRAAAEERIIHWCKKAKLNNKNATLILTGCLSHRTDIEQRLRKSVDYFISIENWVARIEEVITQPSCISPDFYQISGTYKSTFQAYLPVTTGCNNFCSYCVVPYARGRERSLSPENILKEAKNLIAKGYKELYLLGQNVNSYQDIDENGKKWNFSRLLRTIDQIPGNFWIRFISSHPKDVTDEFIETYASCHKVSPNLHLPIQSGSNRVLKLMNRGYTRENYLNLISKFRQIFPNVVFSTDIIVGFPGETEKDFEDSLDIVEKVGFEMLFSLKYSPRPETAAFKLKDSVPPEVKITRQRKLDATWKEIAERKNQRFVGQEIRMLVDRKKTKVDNSGKDRHYLLGKSFDNKDVLADSGSTNIGVTGKWATVKIKEVTALALKGELVRVKK